MISEFLWINIPLMALFFALWVGVPMWMIFKRPDRDPRETRTIPAYLRKQRHGGHARATGADLGGRGAARVGRRQPLLTTRRARLA